MRLFVAVWPPPAVLDGLASLDRVEDRRLRWTTPDQWHVTLRFLGEVGDPGAVMDRLGGHSYPAALATIGPLAETVNPDVLWLPVAGVGGLAASVGAALAAPVEDRPFVGHLTLARSRKGPIPRLPLMALSGSWDVGEITLVQSVLGRGGARYEVIGRQPVG